MESFSFWDVLYLGEPVYKKILLSLEIIKGDFLSNSIVGVAVIWFIAGIFRLYHLKRTYPELKTVLSKD